MLEPARTTARNLWSWWIGELADMWPRRRTGHLAKPPTFREIALRTDGKIEITDVASIAGTSAVIASFTTAEDLKEAAPDSLVAARSKPLIVSVDSQHCFIHRLDLPKSAQRHLAGIIRLEVARLTPFKPSDILSGWFALPSHTDLMSIAHIVLKRDVLEPILSKLQALGLPFPEVLVRDADGTSLPVRLKSLEPPPEDRRDRSWQKICFASGAAAILAALFTIQRIFAQQDARLEEIAVRMDAASKEAQAVRSKIDVLETSLRRVASLKHRKRNAPRLRATWNEVTKILPDTAWLSSLSIEGASLSIEGQARSAEQLIPALDSSPLFESVAFDGPVTRSSGTGLARFTIRMSLSRPAGMAGGTRP